MNGYAILGAMLALILLVTSAPTLSNDTAGDAASEYYDGSEYGYRTYGSGSAADPYRSTITSYSQGTETDIRLTSALEGHPVTAISANAFSGDIMTVIIPQTVAEISDNAFSSCTELTDAFFMGDLPSMGTNAFGSGVTFHYLDGEQGWDGYNGNPKAVLPLYTYAGEGSFSYYVINGEATVHSHLSGSSIIVPSDVATLDGTFRVTSVGPSSFYGLSGITSVVLGDNVVNICERAFYKCSDLAEVKFPAGLRHINDEAFRECGKFQGSGGTLLLPGSLEYLGFEAFRMCHNIASAIIPDSVKVFGDGVLRASRGLETVDLGNTITDLGPWSLDNCTSLKAVKLPESLRTIEDNAFLNCTNLESISIPSNVVSIGSNTFGNCTSLSSVSLGGVQEIGDSAFSNCSSLRSVTIPSSVTKIGDKAFSVCGSMSTALFEGSMPEMGAQMFSGCASDFKVMYKASHAASWSDYSEYDVSVMDDHGDDPMLYIIVALIAATIVIAVAIILIRRRSRS